VRSASRLFRFQFAVGAAGALVLGYAVVAVVRATSLAPPSAQDLLRACAAMELASLQPASLAVAVLATVSATSALRGVVSAVSRVRAHGRLLRVLPPSTPAVFGGMAVRLFSSGRPEAFCAGLACPHIFVSTAAARVLARAELDAVVTHEAHHARRREPLRLLLVGVLRDALFFIPALRDAERRYAALAEVAADEAAVRRAGPEPLAAALLHFGARGDGALGIAAERVDHLLGAAPRWRLRPSLLVSGAVALVGVAILSASVPAGDVSAPLVAMQLCRLTMTVLPILGVLALAGAAWRRAAQR